MGKYYAVANGRSKGVFNSWNDCRKQVNGYSNARFKSFDSKAEANEFIRLNSSGGGSGGTGRGSGYSHSSYSPTSGSRYSPYSSWGSSSGTSTRRSNHGSGVPKAAPKGTDVVYTDGSALNNGRRSAKAGWGVFWGKSSPRNAYGKVSSGAQTNNRGEVEAICEALDQIGSSRADGRKYEIRADSQYAIDSISNWGNKWERNGWRTASGQPVENQDLIQRARSSIRELRESGVDVSLTYVQGHAGHEGNVEADKLARRGADS